MKILRILLFLFFFTLVLQNFIFGQFVSDTLDYSIETLDGNEYYGNIIEDSEKIIRFETPNIGIITIRKSDVRRMTYLRDVKIVNGKYWHDMFQSSRYFWSPNGYCLKRGQGYYQNVWILYNEFAYGISKNFSIGGGMVPLFLFAGAPTPVWVIPKFSLPVVKDKYNIGIGAIAGTILGEMDDDENMNFGILYGVNTFGSEDKNFTLGVGWGYAAGTWAELPVITMSGLVRVGPRGYLMMENFYFDIPDEGGVFISALGGRSMVRSVGMDYGLILPFNLFDQDEFVAVPWLGLTIPINSKAKK